MVIMYDGGKTVLHEHNPAKDKSFQVLFSVYVKCTPAFLCMLSVCLHFSD